ncbi:unnamed protein product [Cyprideis torosa]|uniref:Metalloendopeptidase n=1 Tax=Cyprideis torosa TaxID=163714 RepID=A0A7R8ZPT2_9CRUS|nr:unnamed protein product [Cyprideis torosa]CAG0899668.1 unnamed protein product [Cyprideis torosa]
MEVFQIVLFGFLLGSFASAAPSNSGQETPLEDDQELFEGDIKLPPEFDRAAMNFHYFQNWFSCWPFKTVPYVISSSFSSTEKSQILKAMDEFHKHTCVRFVPRFLQLHYLSIKKLDGCWSYVGKNFFPGPQDLSLGLGCLTTLGTPVHELMHAIGFWHEQSRPDRDDYVTIHWDQIPDAYESNFQKLTSAQVNSFGSAYDFDSVMHYSKYAFALGSLPTITAIDDPNRQLGQRDGFSEQDIIQINKLYNC